jgi:hypothetical protein
VDELAHHDAIKCPVCHKVSPKRAAKHDLRLKAMLENYKDTTDVRNKAESFILCESCDFDHKSATVQCVDCNVLLCHLCEEKHKAHALRAIAHVLEEAEMNLQRLLSELLQIREQASDGRGRLVHQCDYIRILRQESVANIDRTRKALHESIDKHYDNLVAEIRGQTEPTLQNIQGQIACLEVVISDVQGKSDKITDSLKKSDKNALIRCEGELVQSIRNGECYDIGNLVSSLNNREIKYCFYWIFFLNSQKGARSV